MTAQTIGCPLPYRTHTAQRPTQGWGTYLIHPDGRFGEYAEHPQTLSWTPGPSGELQSGDLVTCTVTDRRGPSTEYMFYVGHTADGQAVTTRHRPEYGLESYYVMRPEQLTLIHRPRYQHTVLHDHAPHYWPWQPEHGRRLRWLPEVAAPHAVFQRVTASWGHDFLIVGTDVHTGDLILRPLLDGHDYHFSLSPDDLHRL